MSVPKIEEILLDQNKHVCTAQNYQPKMNKRIKTKTGLLIRHGTGNSPCNQSWAGRESMVGRICETRVALKCSFSNLAYLVNECP